MKCYYCEKSRKLNKDHIIPKSENGRVIVSCCYECNNKKQNFSPFEFYLLGFINDEKLLKVYNYCKELNKNLDDKKLDKLFFSYKKILMDLKNNKLFRYVEKNNLKLNFQVDYEKYENYFYNKKNEMLERYKETKFDKLDDFGIYLKKNKKIKILKKINFNEYLRTKDKKKYVIEIIKANNSNYNIIYSIKDKEKRIILDKEFNQECFSYYNDEYINEIINQIDLKFKKQ